MVIQTREIKSFQLKKIIFASSLFFFECLFLGVLLTYWYNKTHMTGPSGNMLCICPLRFRIASPNLSIDRGAAEVNRKFWGGDPESLEANRSAYYPREQSLFV